MARPLDVHRKGIVSTFAILKISGISLLLSAEVVSYLDEVLQVDHLVLIDVGLTVIAFIQVLGKKPVTHEHQVEQIDSTVTVCISIQHCIDHRGTFSYWVCAGDRIAELVNFRAGEGDGVFAALAEV